VQRGKGENRKINLSPLKRSALNRLLEPYEGLTPVLWGDGRETPSTKHIVSSITNRNLIQQTETVKITR